MVTFVFPGQGAQKKGMGKDLFDSVGLYREIEPQVDAVLGYSLRDLCIHDEKELLNQTRYTQPALYVVNALHYLKAVEDGEKPDSVAGHSLGEYNALLAAGVFDFITGLRLVKKRGELMSSARNGGMAAVIGLSPETVHKVMEDPSLEGMDVANFNSPQQVVISGPEELLGRAKQLLEGEGAKAVMPLPVSSAFHSRYMAPAAEQFSRYLIQFDYAAPAIPVIANTTSAPYPTEDPQKHVPEILAGQVTGSVRWQETIEYLLGTGEEVFREVGPANVLTKLIDQIRVTN